MYGFLSAFSKFLMNVRPLPVITYIHQYNLFDLQRKLLLKKAY